MSAPLEAVNRLFPSTQILRLSFSKSSVRLGNPSIPKVSRKNRISSLNIHKLSNTKVTLHGHIVKLLDNQQQQKEETVLLIISCG